MRLLQNKWIHKIQTGLWFLRRPSYYPQMIRYSLKKLFPASSISINNQKTPTEYEEYAVTTQQALQKLLALSQITPVRELFPDVFSAAQQQQDQCPVKMGGAGNLDLLYWSARTISATTIIETGVAYGWSSLALLLSLQDIDKGMLFSTDMPYANTQSENFAGCVVPERLRSKWTLVQKPDRDGLPGILKSVNSFDLCHYDSDKSYKGRMWAYPLLFNKLRKGGIFISDDVSNDHAFLEFAHKQGLPFSIIKIISYGKPHYQGIILKTN